MLAGENKKLMSLSFRQSVYALPRTIVLIVVKGIEIEREMGIFNTE